MIFSALSQSGRYAALHPLFQRAFDYIRDTDLFALAPGRYHIAGDDLIAIVEQVPAKTKEMAKLEAHRRYIDIQLVLEGDEAMGWKPLEDCLNPVSEHSEERDIRFFHDAPASWMCRYRRIISASSSRKMHTHRWWAAARTQGDLQGRRDSRVTASCRLRAATSIIGSQSDPWRR